MYEKDLALNNLQWLLCHKTKPNQTKSFIFDIYMYKKVLSDFHWYCIFAFFVAVLRLFLGFLVFIFILQLGT